MASSLIHRCHHCGYESEVSSSLSAFSENPHCRKCGLSASESDTKMQDDLSALFSRNLVVGDVSEHNQAQATPIWTSNNQSVSNHGPSPITYSITQHYHHSAHQASIKAPSQQSMAYPSGQIKPEEVLLQNNIDPASLTLSQLSLIQNADQEQMLRLVELWRISAPESQGQDSRMDGADDNMDNMEFNGGDRASAEPYMLSGYELLAKRDYDLSASKPSLQEPKQTFSPLGSAVGQKYHPRSDPSYDSRGWWQHGMENQPMEYQYGAFEHYSNYIMNTPGRESSMGDQGML